MNRLAQMFEVNGSYTPTKASLYLKRVGVNTAMYFDLDDGTAVIDATNFNTISQQPNPLMFDDRDKNFTGNGFLIAQETEFDRATVEYATVNYNVKSTSHKKFNMYLRGQGLTGFFRATITIDGKEIDTLNKPAIGLTWRLFKTSFILPDSEIHEIGIRLEENDNALDKIYIDEDAASPDGGGPDLTTSPFVTTHLQVYNTASSTPTTPLPIYAWKTTGEIIIDDWYNYDINVISDTVSLTFDSTYALVLSSSGGTNTNYVIWELVDNDEYLALPSAIKV